MTREELMEKRAAIVGNVIQLNQEEMEATKVEIDDLERAYTAFRVSVDRMMQAKKALYDTIRRLRPELADFELWYDPSTGAVMGNKK